MALIIMAAPRPAPNWHSCIASAVLGGYRGSVVVCLDAYWSGLPEQERDLYEHHGVEISTLAEWERVAQRGRTPKMRALFNALRCFEEAAARPGFHVVVEDDVTFARGWADVVQRAGDDDPVTLGYCRDDMGREPTRERHATWDATLCVGLSRERAVDAARALFNELQKPDPLPADNALSQHWRETHTPRLTLNPPIVQHLGDVAIVNPSDGRRRAPSWTGSAHR